MFYIKKLFPILGIVFISIPLYSKEIKVCPDCEIQSIRTAIDQSKDQDTILVGSGNYNESPIVIEKSITLKGIDRPVIDGNFHGNSIEVRADGVEIQGFTIKNGKVSDIKEFGGIYLNKVSKASIIDNQFINNAYSIYVDKSKDSLIEKNIMLGNAVNEVSGGNGVHLWTSHRITIKNNQISKHRDGLYFEFSEDLIVENNTVMESIRYGMHFMFSHRSKITNNKFTKNSTGAAIMYSRKIDLKNNIFEFSKGTSSYGILLKDITDGSMIGNTFLNNTIGIFGDSFTRNKINHNRIQGNGWAVQILGSCDSNVFEKNIFDDNIFDISTNSKQSANRFHNNYWNKYEGFDLDRDGKGDIPHSPVSFFSYWVARYNVLLILLESPVVRFLEIAERMFPIMRPKSLLDEEPLILKEGMEFK